MSTHAAETYMLVSSQFQHMLGDVMHQARDELVHILHAGQHMLSNDVSTPGILVVVVEGNASTAQVCDKLTKGIHRHAAPDEKLNLSLVDCLHRIKSGGESSSSIVTFRSYHGQQEA